MKTLEEIITERLIVEDDGYTEGRVSIQSIKDICILAQKQALQNASDNAKQFDANEGKCGGMLIPCLFVDKQSILNENNLVI